VTGLSADGSYTAFVQQCMEELQGLG